jgi:ubiquinone/menaquinone biosynthesis C-methylase UbiE
MILNTAEKLLMNNPIREFLQLYYEAPLLKMLGAKAEGLTVLEVGCGRGVGTEILLEYFGAKEVVCFDLDVRMVKLAKKRLSHFGNRVRIYQADASSIPESDNSFDAVFDFGIIHHVPNWQLAVREIARVLRPEGLFVFEEVTKQALDRLIYRVLLDHPKSNRFNQKEFTEGLVQGGFEISQLQDRFFGDFIFGVAKKIKNPV